MKLSEEAYNLIIDILTNEANNMELGEDRTAIENAMNELDEIGIY